MSRLEKRFLMIPWLLTFHHAMLKKKTERRQAADNHSKTKMYGQMEYYNEIR